MGYANQLKYHIKTSVRVDCSAKFRKILELSFCLQHLDWKRRCWLQTTQPDSEHFMLNIFDKITYDEKDKQEPSQRSSSCKVSVSLLHVKCVHMCMRGLMMCSVNYIYAYQLCYLMATTDLSLKYSNVTVKHVNLVISYFIKDLIASTLFLFHLLQRHHTNCPYRLKKARRSWMD